MSNRLFQLVGVDGDNVGLYKVPSKMKNWDIQGLFNHAIQDVEVKLAEDEDFELNDLDQHLSEHYKIDRIFVKEVTTEIL